MYIKTSLVAAGFLISTQTLAANFYVASSGSGNSCIASNPCASIQVAVNIAGVDDTIHIRKGTYVENITIPMGKDGLHIRGENREDTFVVSAGGDVTPKQAPPGVPIDVVFDVFSSDVTIEKLAIQHPGGIATKRDLGVFVRPPAKNITIQKTEINRNRSGDVLEPTAPGSRGVFVLRATGTTITKNIISGNYEDHLHIPSSETTITKNKVIDAKRVGIVIIQENATSLSINNIITKNEVSNSGTDGIQIQGDNNIVAKNTVESNNGVGIKLCGASDCVAPGVTAVASYNSVVKNKVSNNVVGNIVDDGTNNSIE